MLRSTRDRAERVVRTMALLIGRRTDAAWWSNNQNLHASWVRRTELIAGAIPDGSVVLEFGAGSQALRSLLPPSCRYVASDVVARSPETLVCDLNSRPLPDLGHVKATVTVLSGVLEYVHGIDEVARWLAGVAPVCIASYCPAKVRFPGERLIKAAVRSQNGWVSSLTRRELERAFESAGFRASPIDSWRGHEIIRFERG